MQTTAADRDDLSRRVEATSDPRLSNFDAAALSCIVYAHLDRCGEGTATVPAQGTCAGCVHTHGTKWLRSRHDRLTADANHGGRGARYHL